MGQGQGFDYLPVLLEAAGHMLDASIVGVALIGVLLGLVIGFLPGIGSLLALALLLPFTFGMSPFMAFALLLAMYSASTVASDMTSILFGIPGQPDSAATVLDGHPMARAGLAERAMGISAISSALGGLLGALVLALSVPIMRPIVLAVGPPESFMLTVLGATIIGTVSGRSAVKGMAVAGIGLLLAAVGTNPQTGIYRYTLGLLYLVDGVPIVPIAIGLFAVPEIIALHRRRATIAAAGGGGRSRARDGFGDVARHWGALVRGSTIGIAFGMLPGVGGPVAQWAAYGSARLGSKEPERFGYGAIEGVVAPSAANCSKDGGQLVPTLAFGIPGGAAMAVLLGAFLILGLNPGPEMLGAELDVTFFMVLVIIFGNLAGALICFPLFGHMARLTRLQGALLFPFMLPLILIGALASTGLPGDLVLLVLTGLGAYVMQRTDWPVVPLLVGFVLGEKAETQLALSMNIYDGVSWLLRPSVLLISGAIAVVTFVAVRSFRRTNRIPEAQAEEEPASWWGGVAVGLVLLVVALGAFVMALGWPQGARIYPQVIATATGVFVLVALTRVLLDRRRTAPGTAAGGERAEVAPQPPGEPDASATPATDRAPAEEVATGHAAEAPIARADLSTFPAPRPAAAGPLRFLEAKRSSSAIAWVVGTALAVWLLGILPAVALQVLAYLTVVARVRWFHALGLAVITTAFVYGVFMAGLGLSLPPPALWSW